MKTTFEKAKENLDRQINKNRIAGYENRIVTEEEEFNILCGRGVEYDVNGTKIYIPPVKLHQMIGISKLDNIPNTEKGIEEAFKFLAELLDTDLKFLKDNIEMWHLKEITELLVYATKLGSKKLYEKKKLTMLREITQ